MGVKLQFNLCSQVFIVRGMTFRNDQAVERFSIIKERSPRGGTAALIELLHVMKLRQRSPVRFAINLSTGAIVMASVTLIELSKIGHLLIQKRC